MMNIHDAWDKALRETDIIRSRVQSLQTFKETHVPYVLLSASSINPGDTVVRKGEVVVDRPSLILPPNIPQLEGFSLEGLGPSHEESMVNFLLVRGVSVPSLKYDNKTHSLDVFEGDVHAAIRHYGDLLQRQENTLAGLLVGPQDVWPFSLLIFICSQIAKNSATDIRRLLDEYHRGSS